MKHPRVTLDRLFFALSDPARREILRQLAENPRRVGELALSKKLSPPAIAKHLRVLERAGLMQQRAQGRTRVCSIVRQPLAELIEWINGISSASAQPAQRGAREIEPKPRSPSRNRAVLERVFGIL